MDIPIVGLTEMLAEYLVEDKPRPDVKEEA
jgi:hypothetical protein